MTSTESHPYELVIFDCDGVLVDSEPITNVIFAEMLNRLGLSVTLEDMYRDFMGRSAASCRRIIEERLGKPPPDDFFPKLKRRAAQALAEKLTPIAGIESALDEIAMPCCVASSGELEKIRFTLGLTGLRQRFGDRIYSASQVARGKPYPDLFLFAAGQMGAAPSRTAVVEDTVVGVRAGVSAGMTVFGYAALIDAEELAAAGATVFDSMRQLPGLLRAGNTAGRESPAPDQVE